MNLRPTRRRDPTRLFGFLGVLALLAISAVAYVAYHANSGLPWQDRYQVTVEVPSANRLIDAADVRIGGVRVGQVSDVTAMPARPGGRPYARIELALDRSAGPLPVNTTAKVRPASVLGLTYVDLRLGSARRTVPERGTLPLARARRTVELTDLLDVFDRSTARNFRSTLDSLGAGLAGRGAALNQTIGSLDRLLPPLTEVALTLAAPQTRLSGFIRAYSSTFDALAGVDGELAGLVSGAAGTFGALARERAALAAAIELAPGTESATTRAFLRVRPGLDGLAELARELRPATRVLPPTLTDIDTTLEAGLRPLNQLPGLSRRLRTSLTALDRLSRDGATDGTLRKLTPLLEATDRLVEVNAAAQLHCNAIGIWADNFPDVFSAFGTGQGPSIINIGFTEDGAQGEQLQSREPASDVAMNFYPNENAQECESNNEPVGQQIFANPPGLQSRQTRDTDPPPGVRERARSAGLLEDPEGAP